MELVERALDRRTVIPAWLRATALVLLFLVAQMFAYKDLKEKYAVTTSENISLKTTLSDQDLKIKSLENQIKEQSKQFRADAEGLMLRKQKHLANLQTVLRKDAENLLEVAQVLDSEGRVIKMNREISFYQGGMIREPSFYQAEMTHIWKHNVLSDDLRNHYSEYYDKKEALRHRAEGQDKEFRDTLILAEKEIVAPSDLPPIRRRDAAIAFLGKCLGKGFGMKLRVQDGGSYSYESHREKGGGSADIVSAFEAFKSFQPDSELQGRCANLKLHAEEISKKAKELSREAFRLAELTYLDGTCEYLERKE